MAAFSVIEQLEACTGPIQVKRVAEIMGVTTNTIYKMEAAKTIPCYRMGGALRFDPSALSYWVRKQHPAFAAAHREAKKDAA